MSNFLPLACQITWQITTCINFLVIYTFCAASVSRVEWGCKISFTTKKLKPILFVLCEMLSKFSSTRYKVPVLFRLSANIERNFFLPWKYSFQKCFRHQVSLKLLCTSFKSFYENQTLKNLKEIMKIVLLVNVIAIAESFEGCMLQCVRDRWAIIIWNDSFRWFFKYRAFFIWHWLESSH